MKEQIWGSLIHLGSNMWNDFLQAPDKPRISKVIKSVDLLKEARDRYYP